MGPVCMFELLVPGGVDCSGNGICVNSTGSSTCQCNEGWSGTGDFTFASEDCDQYLIVIQVLWGLCASAHGLLFLAGVYNAKDALFVKSTRDSKLFIVSMTLSALCLCVSGVLKVVDPLVYLIGKEPLITVVFSFGTLFYWSAGIIFVKTLGEFYTRKVQMMYTAERKTLAFPLRFVMVCNVFGCLSPIGCLVAPNVCTVFALGHYFLLSFIIIALGGYWVRFFSESFLSALVEVDSFAKKEGARAQSTETDLGRLIGWVRFVKNQTTQLALGNFIIAVIMAWPFMLRKASYQLAIAWITAPGLAFGCISILNDSIRKRKSKSSSKSGSKTFGSDKRLDSYNTSFNSKDQTAQIKSRRDSEESQEV